MFLLDKIICLYHCIFGWIHSCLQDSEGAYYWHVKSGTIQRGVPQHEDSSLEDSSIVRNARSSRIFEPDPSDYVPSTGMQKSCTASSIADLGEAAGVSCSLQQFICKMRHHHVACQRELGI
jgi:hypothetical protein